MAQIKFNYQESLLSICGVITTFQTHPVTWRQSRPFYWLHTWNTV